MALDIVAWFGRTEAAHRAQTDAAVSVGYNTISLSVYGDRTAPAQYAAAMVKRPSSVPERQRLGLSRSSFQAAFTSMTSIGWSPNLVSATGPSWNPLFAASFVMGPPAPFVIIDLTWAGFAAMNTSMRAGGFVLRWADVYGTPDDFRYLGIWETNDDGRAWTVTQDSSQANLKQVFDAMVGGFCRPVQIAGTPSGGFLVIYEDSTGGQWEARAPLSGSAFQTRFDALWPKGLRSVSIRGAGTGPTATLNAIFAEREGRDPRTVRVSGSPGIAAVDNEVIAIMRANMTRGASLAVVADRRLVYARGYTFAEPGYPDALPTTFFRQASVGKMFTAAAIHKLVATGATLPDGSLFTFATPLVSVLPETAAGAVPGWGQITVRHLLEMSSGITAEVVGNDRLASSSLPVSAPDVAGWLSRQPLAGAPGDPNGALYSNSGYMLLGLIVARVQGVPTFIEAIRPLILDPLHIKRVRSSVSRVSAQPSNEARYHAHPPAYATSVIDAGWRLCPAGYGDVNLENLGGGGGLSAAATDVAKVLAALSVTTNNPLMPDAALRRWLNDAGNAWRTLGTRTHGFHGFDGVEILRSLRPGGMRWRGQKGGLLWTSSNAIFFWTGGVSVVMCFNGTTSNPPRPRFDRSIPLIAAIDAQHWDPQADLFPSFAIPRLL